MAGRIAYRKVLGAKNPADLMTKHMSAELSGQHLKTLNMDVGTGRAASAPTLDNIESFVQAWYEDVTEDLKDCEGKQPAETKEEIQEVITKIGAPPVERDLASEPLEMERRNGNGRVRRNVSFNRKVQVRPIPTTGTGRKTPTRGGRAASQSRWAPREVERADAPVSQVSEEADCIFGITGIAVRGDGKRWADLQDDGIEARRSAEPTGVRGMHPGQNNIPIDSVEVQSWDTRPETHTAGKVSAILKSRLAGNVVMHGHCIESASPWHRTAVDRMAGRKFESCGPRSGLHAKYARTDCSHCVDIFPLLDASSPRASSAAGGAQKVGMSRSADRDTCACTYVGDVARTQSVSPLPFPFGGSRCTDPLVCI